MQSNLLERAIRSTTLRNIISALAILSATAPSISATLKWQFTARHFADFSSLLPPIASGFLVTSDTLNERGQYQILEASGVVGSQTILGLSDNPNYHNYVPDNGISFNQTDMFATSGCSGWSYFPIALSTYAHFSCAGVAFSTEAGPVNLSFGGATWVLTESYAQSFITSQVELMQVVPEPRILMLLLVGIASIVFNIGLRQRGKKRI